jgi:hypothetical protein
VNLGWIQTGRCRFQLVDLTHIMQRTNAEKDPHRRGEVLLVSTILLDDYSSV